MECEPSVSKRDLIMAKVKNVESDLFFMSVEVHRYRRGVGDVSNKIKGLVSVESGNRFGKEFKREVQCGSDVRMNKVSSGTGVDKGRYFVFFLNKYGDLEFLFRFEETEEKFCGGVGTRGRGGGRFID